MSHSFSKTFIFSILATILAITGIVTTACKSDVCDTTPPVYNTPATQDVAIKAYLAANTIKADSVSRGLYIANTTVGTGANPKTTSTVTVNYKGYLTNGCVFDQSTSPVTFSLSNLIEGWKIGIPLMKKGGKATMVIPSAIGYGANGTGAKIPGYSILVFEIELVDFQ
jgi:FKBP-type peptidyl-prolyl cis-trans isomerase FkpA